MKQLEKEFLIYLAGFIDADGAIIAQFVYNKTYRWKYQIRFTVQVTQKKKRKWFLEDLRKTIGAGNVRDRDNVSDYFLTEVANVAAFLKQIQPFLRIKKKQANLMLKIIEQLPSSKDSQDKFLELCEQVDQIAELNDSKARKITAKTVATAIEGLKESEVPVETSDFI